RGGGGERAAARGALARPRGGARHRARDSRAAGTTLPRRARGWAGRGVFRRARPHGGAGVAGHRPRGRRGRPGLARRRCPRRRRRERAGSRRLPRGPAGRRDRRRPRRGRGAGRAGRAADGVRVGARATLIYLLRHGEVVQADPRRFIGHLDVPLSARGEAQCLAQAHRLAGASLAALYTSDLGRARRSGEIIGAPHGLTPTLVPDLREMAMGRWEGLTADEIRAREPGAFADWMGRVGEFPFPEGESVPDLLARAGPAFDAIVAGAPGRAIAILAHGRTNRAPLGHALG